MKIIQFILVPALLLVFLFFTSRLKRSALLKFGVAGSIIILIAFVIYPDWSTQVANFLGVGRGVDLITYLGLLALGISVLWLLLKVNRLEDKLTQLVREHALEAQKD